MISTPPSLFFGW